MAKTDPPPDVTGTPAPVAPRSGPGHESGGVRLQLVREAPFEIHFRTDADILTLSLAHTRVECAFNSDRLVFERNRPGMLNFHPAGTEIFVRTLHRAGDMLVLEIPVDLRSSILDPSGSTVLERSQVSVPSPGAIHLVNLARRFLFQGTLTAPLVTESLAALSLAETLSSCGRPLSPAAGALSDRQLAAVLDFIEANLDRNVGLSEIADTCGMTLSQFSRSFKQSTGLSPYRYVVERRVDRARRLLAETSASLAEVAYSAGFSSQSHMTDTFRRHLGTTPGRYRRDDML